MNRVWVLTNPHQSGAIHKAIDEQPLDGSIRITMGKNKVKRSDSQNSLYWLWLTIIGDEIGYTKPEIHDALRAELLMPETYRDLQGATHECLPSTSKMKLGEFAEYLNAIERWASAEGMILPHPEDVYYKAVYGAKRKYERK